MKFCVVKDTHTGYFFGRELDPGYHYSSWTHADPSVDPTWKPLEFFIGTARDNEENCGLIIFENEAKAKEYMSKQWSSYVVEIINLADLQTGEE